MESELDRFVARAVPSPDVSGERVARIKAAVMARLDEREEAVHPVVPAPRPAALFARLGLPLALSLALGVLVGQYATHASVPMASGLALMVSNVYESTVLY